MRGFISVVEDVLELKKTMWFPVTGVNTSSLKQLRLSARRKPKLKS